MPKDLKRSLSVAGHRTSISLEPEFWQALALAALAKHLSVAALVADIDKDRGNRNLSSAIRVWLLQQAQHQS
jgi:predicted DNA-binding ribbon-helix-helix protein